jgi:hypothetical protein
MFTRRINLSRVTGTLFGYTICALVPSPANAQADIVGSRGGLTASPIAAPATPPILPPSLNLPPAATSSLLNGLNSSGAALRPGMGWLVSDMTHQGIHGQQLADVIHQLKPYKQRGVLTFPQPGDDASGFGDGGRGQFFPKLNRGNGKGGGKGGKG